MHVRNMSLSQLGAPIVQQLVSFFGKCFVEAEGMCEFASLDLVWEFRELSSFVFVAQIIR